ncbi:MAG: transposase, partial [Bacteroidetes bacterium]|nr:transposase [Bacteroidota bacterium]
RTLKEDLVYPNDWDNTVEFQRALARWINDYNYDFPHQSLNYLTPNQILS